MTEDDKQFAACLAAPPDSDILIFNTTPELSLQRMASISAVQQRTPSSLAARGDEQPSTPATKRGGGELLRSPSVQQSDNKKGKKVAGTQGGMRRDSGQLADALIQAAMEGEEEGAGAGLGGGGGGGGGAGARAQWDATGLSTPGGRAALAAAASVGGRAVVVGGSGGLPLAQEQPPLTQLFDGCTNAVAALVGTGYLLLQAAGFNRRAPQAIDGLSSGLKRMSMGRRSGVPSLPAGSPATEGGMLTGAF